MQNKRLLFPVILSYIFIISFASCRKSASDPAYANLSSSEMIKLQQYIVQGEQLYQVHCANCHQEDGSGLGKLIPPLNQNDRIRTHRPEIVCSIRNGLERPYSLNGIEYRGKMPENYDLSKLEIAEIVTYISNSWQNKEGITSVIDVENYLRTCP